MKLNKDFLYKALPDAVFYVGNTKISGLTDNLWQTIDQETDVMVSMDSRTVARGDFFVALRGPRFDGHSYIKQALAVGACGVVLSKTRPDCLQALSDEEKAGKLFIVVSETLDAFICLAKAWRSQLTCPVVAITGSVGKTSTKEIVGSILKAAGINAFVSFKNYNNIFGVCYNILRIPEAVAAVVLEVGINEKGEMVQLADIVRPTIGLITCIGHAHLEGLGGSLQGVANEKRLLFNFFGPQDVGIVCGDQALLHDYHYSHPIARFGLKMRNQVQARKIQIKTDDDGVMTTQFLLKWYQEKAMITLHGNHQGFVNNALAASSIAYFLHIPLQAVIDGLNKYQGVESRFEMRKIKGNRGVLLNDCYNANPESMKAALVAFSQLSLSGKKIAVLGDMLELGDKEKYWHRQIGRVISKTGELDHVILVGERSKLIFNTMPHSIPVAFASDWQQAKDILEDVLDGTDCMVLVKASRGIRLDQIVKEIAE